MEQEPSKSNDNDDDSSLDDPETDIHLKSIFVLESNNNDNSSGDNQNDKNFQLTNTIEQCQDKNEEEIDPFSLMEFDKDLSDTNVNDIEDKIEQVYDNDDLPVNLPDVSLLNVASLSNLTELTTDSTSVNISTIFSNSDQKLHNIYNDGDNCKEINPDPDTTPLEEKNREVPKCDSLDQEMSKPADDKKCFRLEDFMRQIITQINTTTGKF